MGYKQTLQFFSHCLVAFCALLLLAACDSDSLNAGIGDLEPTEQDLQNGDFFTDDSFAPKIVSMQLYDICRKTTSGGDQCDPNFGTVRPSQGQSAVSAPVRILITMDKPVFLDEAGQVDITLENGNFLETSGNLQPVIVAGTAESPEYTELDVGDPGVFQKKYQHFSTRHTAGNVYARVDGVVTFTIPDDLVYDINVNKKKIYNRSKSYSYKHDTSAPVPILRLKDSRTVIEQTGLMSAVADEFANVVLEIDWGEDVEKASSNQSFSAVFKNGDNLSISCLSNCAPGFPPNKSYVYFGDGGAGRVFDNGKSTASKFSINLSETGITDGLINTLQDGTIIGLTVASGLVKDAAGNPNVESTEYTVAVDATSPTLQSVRVSTKGGLTASNGSRVLKAGDAVRFNLTLSEPVALYKDTDAQVDFSIAGQSALAVVDFAGSGVLVGDESDQWQLEYIVAEGDGQDLDNNAQEYTSSDWSSDLNLQYSVIAENRVYDRVGNSLDQSNLNDRLFTSDDGSSSFLNLHVDAQSPRIIDSATTIQGFSKKLSADPSEVSTVISNGAKLAIAIPFNEAVQNAIGASLDFSDSAAWMNTSLQAHLFQDSNGGGFLRSVVLNYDDTLTQLAQSRVDEYVYPNIIVYSLIVDPSLPTTGSIRVVGYTGLPGGFLPTELQDVAGNAFDQRQARKEGFNLDILIANLRIDGGPFTVTSIFPMYQNDDGETVVVTPGVARNYVVGDTLYIGVQTTRDINNDLSVTPPTLTVRIQEALSPTQLEVESSGVEYARGESGSRRNFLIFEFPLTGGFYEDFNGVEFVSLNDPAGILQDSNGTALDLNIPIATVQGGTGVLTDVVIDNKAPICSNAYLTDKVTGSVPAIPYTVSSGESLYLAIDCDQRVELRLKDVAEESLVIPASFGADATGVVFRYSNLANAGKRIIYSLPIGPGHRAGNATSSQGPLTIGERADLKLTAFYNTDTDTSGDEDFFVDPKGNVIAIDVATDYFVATTLYDPWSLDTARTTGTAITVDTSSIPVEVRYILPQNGYVDPNGVTYLAGGDGARSDGKNRISIEIDYGVYDDETGEAILSALQFEGDEDITIDIAFADGTFAGVGILDTSTDGSPTSTLKFFMEVGYQTGSVSNQLLRALQANQRLQTPSFETLPFTSADLQSYRQDGAPLTLVTTNVPINDQILATIEGLNNLPQVRVNNTKPELVATDPLNQIYPIEVWVATGQNINSIVPVSSGGSNFSTLNFGDIYFALIFDKDISVDSFQNTKLQLEVKTNTGSVAIDSTDIAWVDNAEIAGFDNGGQVVTSRKVFYKFTYGDSKYESSGFNFNTSALLQIPSSASLEDIYGNRLDTATFYSSTDTTVSQGFDVELIATADIEKVEFDQEFYRFGDTVAVTVETKGRISTSNLPATNTLVLTVRITEDETVANTEQLVYIPLRSSGGITDIAPDTAGYYSEGSTVLNFEYTLDTFGDQFDDDNTNDTDFGIRPSGAIQSCSVPVTTENCSVYLTNVLGRANNVIRQAGLTVSDIPNISVKSSVNSKLLAVELGTGDEITTSLLNIKRRAAGVSTGSTDLTPLTVFNTGDTIVFELSPVLQNRAVFTSTPTLNNLVEATSGGEPVFNFSLYNIAASALVQRTASYEGVSRSAVLFEYIVQNGDYIGQPSDAESIVLANGVDTTDDRPVQLSLDTLLTTASNATESAFTKITDSLYQNPLAGRVTDASGDFRTDVITYSGFSVDTRTYITGITSLLIPGSYTVDQTVDFVVEMSETVDISTTNSPAFIVAIGATQIRAEFTRFEGGDTKRPVFRFIAPSDVLGTAEVLDVSFDGTTTFVRTDNVNINTNLAGVDRGLALNFDSQIPEIAGVTLISNIGVYSKSSTGLGSMRVALELNKNVSISNSVGNEPKIDVALMTKTGSTEAYTMVFDGVDTASTSTLTFALNVLNLSDNIQSYSGIDVTATAVNIASTTISDLFGNSLKTDLSTDRYNAITAIEAFDVAFDTSAPTIRTIFETRGGSTKNNADYSADGEIEFQVVFDETVDFSTLIPTQFVLDVSLDTQTKQARVDFNGVNANLSTYSFVLDTGSGYVAQRGEVFVRNITISSTGSIKDKGGNDLNASFSFTSRDMAHVMVDAQAPVVSSITVTPTTYTSDSTIDAVFTFSEPVSTIGANPSINVDLITNTGTNIERLFTYNRANTSSELVFSYTVISTDSVSESARVKSPFLPNPFTQASIITDAFGNPATNVFTTSAIIPNIIVNPNVSALITGVKAYIQSPTDSNPVLIDALSTTSYGLNHLLYMEVQYDKSLTVDTTGGTPSLDFNVGSTGALMLDLTNDINGNDDTTLTFGIEALAQVGLSAQEGIQTSGLMRLNGAVLAVDGVASGAAPPSRGVGGNFDNDVDKDGFLESVVIDTKAAEITDVSADKGFFKEADTIVFELTLDESVNVLSGDLHLLIELDGGNQKPATYVSGLNSKSLFFSYTVANGDGYTENGIRVVSLAGTATTLNDSLGNQESLPMNINQILPETVVDTIKPGILTLKEANDNVDPISGAIVEGSVTNDSTPTLTWFLPSGVLQAGSTATLYNDITGTDVERKQYTITNGDTNQGQIDITTDLPTGSYRLKTRLIDVAGNASDNFSSTISFEVDATPPEQPTLTVADSRGAITSGGTADSTTLQMGVDFVGGELITTSYRLAIFDANDSDKQLYNEVLTVAQAANSSATVTIENLVPGQTYGFYARLRDAAANGTHSDTVQVTISNPPRVAEMNPIEVNDVNTNGFYDSGDVITIRLNDRYRSDHIAIAEISIINASLGNSASISPASGATSEYMITLGTDTTVKQGDELIVDTSRVTTGIGIPAGADLVYVLPDITPPGAVGNAVFNDTGLQNNGSTGEGDTIVLTISEPIEVTRIDENSVSVGSGESFGSGHTVAMIGDTRNTGFAQRILITLGSSVSLSASTMIRVAQADVVDAAGLDATSDLLYGGLFNSDGRIEDILIVPKTYFEGDVVSISVVLQGDANIDPISTTSGPNVRKLTMTLDVAGTEVLAESVGVTDKTITFEYRPLGFIDTDGISIVDNSIQGGSSITINGNPVNLDFTGYHFPNVIIDALFDLYKATNMWFDGADIDGDGDISDQADGDDVTELRSKSRNFTILTPPGTAPTLVKDPSNNGLLSVDFNGTTQRLQGNAVRIPSGLGILGYSLFAALTPATLAPAGGLIFGVDDTSSKGQVLSLNASNYSLKCQNELTADENVIGTVIPDSSVFLSIIALRNIVNRYQYFSQSDMTGDSTQFCETSNLAQTAFFGQIAMGGSAESGGSKYYKGTVNEVLSFNQALSFAGKSVVENYLSAKWNSQAAMNKDYYDGDDSGKGDYDFGVTGILKEAATTVGATNLPISAITAARTPGLQITNSTVDGFIKHVGDSFFVGSKGSGGTTSDLPNSVGVSTVRSDVVWYVDIRDAYTQGGKVDITFEPSAMFFDGSGSAGDYELLWRSGNTGAFTAIATASEAGHDRVTFSAITIATQVSPSVIAVTGSNQIQNGYFTLGMKDETPPTLRSAEMSGTNGLIFTFNEALDLPGDVGDPVQVSFSTLGTSASNGDQVGSFKIGAYKNKLVGTVTAEPGKEVDSPVDLKYTSGTVNDLTDVAGNVLNIIDVLHIGNDDEPFDSKNRINTSSGNGNSSNIFPNRGYDDIRISDTATGINRIDYNFITDGGTNPNDPRYKNEVVFGFKITRGDLLDLSDLVRYRHGQDISNFIRFTLRSGFHTRVLININGDIKNSGYDLRIDLINVVDYEQDFLLENNIVLLPY